MMSRACTRATILRVPKESSMKFQPKSVLYRVVADEIRIKDISKVILIWSVILALLIRGRKDYIKLND